MQLYSLLTSLHMNIAQQAKIIVLFKASSDRIQRQYHEVIRELFIKIPILAVQEDYSFKYHLLNLFDCMNSKYISFLVDDIVFIRRFSYKEILPWCRRGYIPSLRLGSNICHSYMTDEHEGLPKLSNKSNMLTWKWSEGGIDWSYPLSLDGNIFSRSEMFELLKVLEFHSPNTLEQALQTYNDRFRKRKGICFYNPVLVNIPCNKVQTDYTDNRSGDVDVSFLADQWDSGMRIRVEDYQELNVNSVHAELPITFVKR